MILRIGSIWVIFLSVVVNTEEIAMEMAFTRKYSTNTALCATALMILSFRTEMSGQTVQTQIRQLLEEQSDQGLHCLLFHLHLFDEIP